MDLGGHRMGVVYFLRRKVHFPFGYLGFVAGDEEPGISGYRIFHAAYDGCAFEEKASEGELSGGIVLRSGLLKVDEFLVVDTRGAGGGEFAFDFGKVLWRVLVALRGGEAKPVGGLFEIGGDDHAGFVEGAEHALGGGVAAFCGGAHVTDH